MRDFSQFGCHSVCIHSQGLSPLSWLSFFRPSFLLGPRIQSRSGLAARAAQGSPREHRLNEHRVLDPVATNPLGGFVSIVRDAPTSNDHGLNQVLTDLVGISESPALEAAYLHESRGLKRIVRL